MSAALAPQPPPARISIAGLSIIAGDRVLIRDLSTEFHAGEFVAILGRNGSGKTLTLHTIAHLRRPVAGAVAIEGRPLAHTPRLELARRIGLLPQDPESGHSMSAIEAVLVGRHPHLAPWQWNGMRDRDIALAALERVGLAAAAARPLPTFSGGEQRRIAIAALLAQDPPIVLLDEPTNHLDPNQALDVLDLFRERCRAGGTVLATLHDPTLAARYADRVLLLFGDGRWIDGAASEHLTGTRLSELYGVPIGEARVGDRRVFFMR